MVGIYRSAIGGMHPILALGSRRLAAMRTGAVSFSRSLAQARQVSVGPIAHDLLEGFLHSHIAQVQDTYGPTILTCPQLDNVQLAFAGNDVCQFRLCGMHRSGSQSEFIRLAKRNYD
jgi:hypothetical protein